MRQALHDSLHKSLRLALSALALTVLASPAHAQATRPEPPYLELSAQAVRSAPNDLARATLFVEMTDANPADLAKKVNARVAEVLAQLRGNTAIKTSSSGTFTYPNYAKGGTRIESWRMRSDIALESRNIAALSEAVGKLQALAAIAQLDVSPAPETQQKAQDEAMVEALKAFQTRAGVAAQALGKRWRIRHVNVNGAEPRPPVPMRAYKTMAMDAAQAAPVEAGESNIVVTVHGSVELID